MLSPRIFEEDSELSDEKIRKLGFEPLVKGPKVVALQDALKLAGFDCGTSDGDFGGMTTKALIALQKSNPSLTANGIYDEATRNCLLSLLGQAGDVSTR